MNLTEIIEINNGSCEEIIKRLLPHRKLIDREISYLIFDAKVTFTLLAKTFI